LFFLFTADAEDKLEPISEDSFEICVPSVNETLMQTLISSACTVAVSSARKELLADIERLEQENEALQGKIRQLEAERGRSTSVSSSASARAMSDKE
jgi:hypothetical protein